MNAKQLAAQERRDALLTEFNAAVEAVQTSDSFRDWLNTRARFHTYSFINTLLIWHQCPHATHVAGFRKWKVEFNRQVLKGEKSIRIFAPNMVRCKPGDDDYAVGSDGRPVLRIRGFRTVGVFDVSQTEGDPLPGRVTTEPITGDSHAHFWEQLVDLAKHLDFSVDVEPLDTADGICFGQTRRIAIHEGLAPNARVAVLIHELVHAQGVSRQHFSAAEAETIAESVAYVVCQGIGLDTSSASVSYVAGWSTSADRAFALSFIDYYAAVIEKVLGLRGSVPARPVHPQDVADASATSEGVAQ